MHTLVLKLAAVLIGGYVILVLVMFVAQRSLLYLPDARPVADTTLTTLELTAWPSATDARGYLADSRDARITVVVFHGNAGRAIDRHHYVTALREERVRILLAEYPGYGGRDGKPDENSLVNDARKTLLKAADAFPNDPLYLLGESLGAGVAAAAANPAFPAGKAVDALLLITPWDSLQSVASRHYPYLPVRWLLRDRYDSIGHLANVEIPKAVVLAEHDSIIPVAHGQALYQQLPASKQRILIAGAQHNDWPARVDTHWWADVFRYLSGVASTR